MGCVPQGQGWAPISLEDLEDLGETFILVPNLGNARKHRGHCPLILKRTTVKWGLLDTLVEW